jgi:hypothetical protein
MPRSVIDRGHIRYQVIRILAAGEKTQVEIAAQFGCAQNTVSDFAKKYAERIAVVRDKLDDDFAGLWIADKAQRLAEYEDDVQKIGELIEASENDSAIVKAQLGTLFRAKQAAVRAAAEELGSLPSRQELRIQSEPVTYRIEGVNTEDLK